MSPLMKPASMSTTSLEAPWRCHPSPDTNSGCLLETQRPTTPGMGGGKDTCIYWFVPRKSGGREGAVLPYHGHDNVRFAGCGPVVALAKAPTATADEDASGCKRWYAGIHHGMPIMPYVSTAGRPMVSSTAPPR